MMRDKQVHVFTYLILILPSHDMKLTCIEVRVSRIRFFVNSFALMKELELIWLSHDMKMTCIQDRVSQPCFF